LAAQLLQESAISARVCSDLADVAGHLGDASNAILLAEEALVAPQIPVLLEALDRQPAWSDIPVVILTSSGPNEDVGIKILKTFGPKANITLLERPLRAVTLISTLEVALRARRRQREVCYLIAQRETTLASIKDAFSALDREWRYVYVNDKVAELSGIPKKELLGRVIWEIFPKEIGSEFYQRCHRALESQRPEQFEMFYEEDSGRWLDTRIYPAENGVVIFRADVTERKNVEMELARTKQEAEEANRAKDRFLAMLSHELRTPLTPVLMTIASLQREPDLSDDIRGDLEVLRRNVELEALLIDDLLDLTRIAHGKLELHNDAVDLHATIEHALTISAGDLTGKNIRVTRRLEAREHHCWGDPARLQQVFWNLVKNSAKFTPDEGHLEISTRNMEAHQIVIEITDTGIGIDPKLLPRIFDAFEQGGAVITGKYGGLGLGLAISKRVVDLHHGRIEARSDGPGRGASFTVMLNAMETSMLEGPVLFLESEPPRIKHLQILFVEDHEDTARVLGRILRNAGFDVSHAGTVAEARALAASERFDLLISDLGLPDGSGLELMRALRDAQGIKGIALSGFGTDEDVAASSAAGFAAHLTKPVDWDRLRAEIERIRPVENSAARSAA
ncbi:MAG: ATP-binding protein, partial [Verrucomicrobiota bacterium]|nr:ATP-binding protein [Verrucomicrobiota bacterium]